MKKLIDISPDGYCIPMECDTSLQEIMETLFEYQQTGLTPEQIMALLLDLKTKNYCSYCGNEIKLNTEVKIK